MATVNIAINNKIWYTNTTMSINHIHWSALKVGDIVHYTDYNDNDESLMVIERIEKDSTGVFCVPLIISGAQILCISGYELERNGKFLGTMNLDWARLLYGQED